MQMHQDDLCLLLVDDDPLTLKSLRLLFSKSGHHVVTASNGLEAQNILKKEGFERFGCVLTDFRMPEMTGLELVDWLQSTNAALSSILLTAEGDKSMIARALRGGVCDFIEKPYRFAHVKDAVARAVDRTLKNRALASTVSEVRDITQLQERLNFAQRGLIFEEGANGAAKVTIRLHPIKETGGDFLNSYPMPDGRLCVLVGDVSGHDLKAGFISAYFQGMVRGMLDMQAGIRDICENFNRHLIEDWNRPLSEADRSPLKTSLACALLVFDFKEQVLQLHNHGIPSPVCFDTAMRVQTIGGGSPPLGWFEDLGAKPDVFALDAEGECFAWSDGLDDYAEDLGVSSITLASKLVREDDAQLREAMIKNRKDDILLVSVRWERTDTQSDLFPVFFETYGGSSKHRIDEYEKYIRTSLRWVLINATDERLGEIVLCIREALINAVLHGASTPSHRAWMAISTNAKEDCLYVVIGDDGEGFELPCLQCDAQADREGHISFGLRIIHSYARRVQFRDEGRIICMEFDL